MTRARHIAVVAALVAAAWSGAAWGHGGEDDALEKTPARALVQQALALLSQEDKAVEAHERVEAALKSNDRRGVDPAQIRSAQDAFDRGDHAAARRALNAALAAPTREPTTRDETSGDESGDATARGESSGMADTPKGALDHMPEYEPARGAAEWIALGAGLTLLIAVAIPARAAHSRTHRPSARP